jgi:hypothetical protein
VSINPNYPVIEYAWGPLYGAGGGAAQPTKRVNVTERTQGTAGTQRGRQYELDQVQSGTLTATLGNVDAALDPTNAAGPFAGAIQPFQPFAMRAQYPPTVNLLTAPQATGGDGFTAGLIPANLYVESRDPSAQIVASATAFQGSNVFQFAALTSWGSGTDIAQTAQPAAKPGKTYTCQAWVRNITPGTSMQVKATITYYDTNGALTGKVSGTIATLTGSASAAWSQVTVTATLPANAYGLRVGTQTNGAIAANCTVQMDGWQLEEGSSATAWVQPGTWYPMYSGFTERWPQAWNLDNTYSVVTPEAADALALLSQVQLSDPLTSELQGHTPRFLYKLDDPQGTTAFADDTGNFPPAQLTNSKYGNGTVTAGADITAASTAGTFVSGGTVTNFSNSRTGPTGTFLNLTSAGIVGPQATTFTRLIAFRFTGTPDGNEIDLWQTVDTNNGANPGAQLRLYLDSSGNANVLMSSFAVGGIQLTIPKVCTDGNWHLMAVGLDVSGSRFFLALDSQYTSGDPGAGGQGTLEYFPRNLLTDSVGLAAAPTGGVSAQYNGDIAYVAELASALSATDCANLYGAWRSANAGESTDQRYARILRYAGYAGATSIEPGLTTSMSGATGLAGADALSALQAVVETENGEHFVSKDGTLVFRSRGHRLNAFTPVYVFGEHAGEFPYESLALDFDATHLANMVTVTQGSTSQAFSANDLAKQAKYFPRVMTRTISASNPLECQDAANYLLSRYSTPLSRVSSMVLNPSGNPALWPVCLALELGDRVRVMRRPIGAPAIQIEAFVEQLSWNVDSGGVATLTVQCSPADDTPYGLFTSWRSTVQSASSVGATSITVNASPDNVNPLAAQLAPGQSLVLSMGDAAHQETVTVQSIGATVSGWSSAVINLVSPTTRTHPIGAVVCEPLPAGVTDPTTYDAVGAFDSVSFSY